MGVEHCTETSRSECIFRAPDREDTWQPEGGGEGPGLKLGISPASGAQQWLQGHTVASRGQSAPDRPAGPARGSVPPGFARLGLTRPGFFPQLCAGAQKPREGSPGPGPGLGPNSELKA